MTEPPSDPEDVKIINLARSALARTGTAQAACLRDSDGRTYAGVRVDLPHLQLSAVDVCVAMAVSSGAEGVEAVAVASVDAAAEADLDVLGDLPGTDVVVWTVDPRGAVRSRTAP